MMTILRFLVEFVTDMLSLWGRSLDNRLMDERLRRYGRR